jgi:predicted nucleic acid-binding protein
VVTKYFDSSALVALYVPEAFSSRAHREARSAGQVAFTVFHDLEVRNAFRVLHGRRVITAEELGGVSTHLDEDLDEQRLVRTPIDLFRVFDRARELSLAHSARLLCRSLDVLHVAAALELHCAGLVSADERQLSLGRAVGLRGIDIAQRRRRGGRRGR